MDRRGFLKATAAGALAGAVSAGARAQAAPIRCGLLGIDHAHGRSALKVLKGLDEYEVAGVCEPDDAVRARFESDPALEGVPWLAKEDLLGDDSIRMIAVESFVPRLLGFAEEAVDAGKHIYLDKPAGTDLRHFERVLDKAAQQDLLVQMGYMYRYNPGFDLIRDAVTNGWLGDVYAIHASMCTYQDAAKRDRLDFHPGGMMLELGCHLIDMIVVIMGAPESVTSFPRHHAGFDDDLADNCVAVFDYPKATVTVETSAMEPAAFGARRFKISGSNGTIILSPLEPPKARISLHEAGGGHPKGVTEIDLPNLRRHRLDLLDLAACIRGEAEFAYSKDHDYQTQRAILLACGVDVDGEG